MINAITELVAEPEECFLAAFDADVEAAAEILGQLLVPDMPWPDRMAVG